MNILTAANFVQNATVHHVNHQQNIRTLSAWKIFPKRSVTDYLVDYVFCFLTTKNDEHCFIVKLKCAGNELYSIKFADFKDTCPKNFSTFVNNIESYNSLLTDLSATIEDQKKIVEECFDSETLKPYKTDPSKVDITKLPESIDA
uniref:Longin domain-containing protein n=1 Tax=Panagrolaimus sp. ES5 TaxID=591445 RepID=A0AC34G9T5_9BILA